MTLATLRRIEVSEDDSSAPDEPADIMNEPVNSMVNSRRPRVRKRAAHPVEVNRTRQGGGRFR